MELHEGNGRRERGQYVLRNYSCYLFISVLLVGLLFWFCFFLKATPDSLLFAKKHDVLINRRNTELFVELWHFYLLLP